MGLALTQIRTFVVGGGGGEKQDMLVPFVDPLPRAASPAPTPPARDARRRRKRAGGGLAAVDVNSPNTARRKAMVARAKRRVRSSKLRRRALASSLAAAAQGSASSASSAGAAAAAPRATANASSSASAAAATEAPPTTRGAALGASGVDTRDPVPIRRRSGGSRLLKHVLSRHAPAPTTATAPTSAGPASATGRPPTTTKDPTATTRVRPETHRAAATATPAPPAELTSLRQQRTRGAFSPLSSLSEATATKKTKKNSMPRQATSLPKADATRAPPPPSHAAPRHPSRRVLVPEDPVLLSSDPAVWRSWLDAHVYAASPLSTAAISPIPHVHATTSPEGPAAGAPAEPTALSAEANPADAELSSITARAGVLTAFSSIASPTTALRPSSPLPSVSHTLLPLAPFRTTVVAGSKSTTRFRRSAGSRFRAYDAAAAAVADAQVIPFRARSSRPLDPVAQNLQRGPMIVPDDPSEVHAQLVEILGDLTTENTAGAAAAAGAGAGAAAGAESAASTSTTSQSSAGEEKELEAATQTQEQHAEASATTEAVSSINEESPAAQEEETGPAFVINPSSAINNATSGGTSRAEASAPWASGERYGWVQVSPSPSANDMMITLPHVVR